MCDGDRIGHGQYGSRDGQRRRRCGPRQGRNGPGHEHRQRRLRRLRGGCGQFGRDRRAHRGREGESDRDGGWHGGFGEFGIGPCADVHRHGPAAFDTSYQALAQIVASPLAADVNSVLGANSNLNAAFGSATAELGLGDLGGRHDANGANVETINSSVDLVVDPTKLSVRKDLILGLYSGTSIGSGFSSLTFNVDVGSTHGVVNQTFTSVTAAHSYAAFAPSSADTGPSYAAPDSAGTLAAATGIKPAHAA